MPLRFRRRPSAASMPEESRLERQHAELLRRKEEIERRLHMLPSVIEAKRQQQAEQISSRARHASRPISPAGASMRKPNRVRTPVERAKEARLKAFALLAIFAIILLLVLRAIPSP